MKILSDHLVNLIEYAEFKGFSKKESVVEKGQHIDAQYYLEQYEILFENSDNTYFGLYFGFFLNLKALGSVYDMSLATSSIGQAVGLWSDYSEMNFPLIRFHSFIDNEMFILELDNGLENNSIKNQIIDTFFTFVYRELKMMIGSNDINLYLPYKNRKEYIALFGCKIDYRQKHTFSFNKRILDAEINSNNKKIIEYLLPSFIKQLNKKENDNFSSLVKQMTLNLCNPELPTLQQVSIQFSMTERTLQRRLRMEQTSFRNITNEIKCLLSKYLKKEKNIKTKDIAFILGYSSSSSFLHAKKRWL